MKTFYKYPLIIGDAQVISIPDFSTAHVGLDPSGHVCLWALVDPTDISVDHTILIRGTGHAVLDDVCYLGSVTQGHFVWHVFKVVR